MLARYVAPLQAGETVKFRPRGNSMKGRIEDGQLVTVEPHKGNLEIGDAVLCKVEGSVYVHLIKEIEGERYLIGNNKGGINGWTTIDKIYGKVVAIEN